MSSKSLAQRVMEQGQGILRLAPAWVPRSFLVLGRRIKLHPDDYFALGGERGGISELNEFLRSLSWIKTD